MSRQNACAGPFGAFYDFWIEREGIARVVGATLWGIDVRPLYASIERAIAGAPDGATVLDVPCGGGVAFRALREDHDLRYLAVDIDEDMLARARRRAPRQVEVMAGDMRDLALDDDSVDVALTYSGLHMIPDPARAVAELGRVTRPGGTLTGSAFVVPGTLRQRIAFGLGARTGHAMPNISEADLARWLADAGFTDARFDTRNGFTVFEARRA